jgi:hypothetical protein
MAEGFDLEHIRERKRALVALVELQRSVVELEWSRLRASGSIWWSPGRWRERWVPAVGAAAAGLGLLTARRMGTLSRLATRGVAAWQVYRQMRALWKGRRGS